AVQLPPPTQANGVIARQTAAVAAPAGSRLAQDIERAAKVGREVGIYPLRDQPGQELVQLAADNDYDLVVLDGAPRDSSTNGRAVWHDYVREHASCAVCLLTLPLIPREVVDTTPSGPDTPD